MFGRDLSKLLRWLPLINLTICLCANIGHATIIQSVKNSADKGAGGAQGIILGLDNVGSIEFSNWSLDNISFNSPKTFLVPMLASEPVTMATGTAEVSFAVNLNTPILGLRLNDRKYSVLTSMASPLFGQTYGIFDDDKALWLAREITVKMNNQYLTLPLLATTAALALPPDLSSSLAAHAHAAQSNTPQWTLPLEGRLGDADGDGLLDGILVALVEIPSSHKGLLGSYWLLRQGFISDFPAQGLRIGALPGRRKHVKSGERDALTVREP